MPSGTKMLLEMDKRPSATDRTEIIRIVVAEILTVCNMPRERHITEIARKAKLLTPSMTLF